MAHFFFYRIPAEPELRKRWLHNIGQPKDWIPSDSTRVCSRHFLPDDIDTSSGIVRLVRDALPTKNLPTLPKDGIWERVVRVNAGYQLRRERRRARSLLELLVFKLIILYYNMFPDRKRWS